MKTIKNVSMGMSWSSYAACLYGALRASGMYNDELSMMMGETGISFQFIIEKQSCPSGPTVYNWINEHFEMTDRIGSASSIFMMHKDPRYNTFEEAQKHAIVMIKESIDRGFPAIVWAPSPILEFGLITGYDDDDKVFFVDDCSPQESDPLLYQNIGISGVPILYVQSCYAKVDYDREKTVRNSLIYGLTHWNTEFHESQNYSAGKKAWENLIAAFENRNLDGFGLTYTMNLYAERKRKIHEYLTKVSETISCFSGLKDALVSANKTASCMEQIAAKLPFQGPGVNSLQQSDIPDLLSLAKEAYEAEEKTMNLIGKIIQ